MTRAPRFTRTVANLPATVPFVGSDTLERRLGKPFAVRLGANESRFGPSPRAVQAMVDTAPETWMYGDADSHDLRQALARLHNIDAEAIVMGGGIDGLLGELVRLVVDPGDPVVTSDGAYPTFTYHVAGHGGTLHRVPYAGDHEDPDALIAKARETRAKLVYIANPDNPMGSWHSAATITAMIADLPDDCMLALDEAYMDLAPAGAEPLFDTSDPRVIRFRTFSKAHGLAGLRLGYAIGAPSTIAMFDRIRNHFGVTRMAQAAGLASLRDVEWLRHVKTRVTAARVELNEIAIAHGLRPLPSATNFVAMECGGDGDRARAVLAGLQARGVFVRMPGVAPLDRCIRVSCGLPEDHALLDAALSATLREIDG